MADMESNQRPFPRVAEFYDGKSVFITGAAGYLGVLILETLLELCPGVRNVYILLRERRGVSPEKRRAALMQRPVFDIVKKKYPEAIEKVRVVSGDVSKPDFGMSDEDLKTVVEDASIMFHCAACVNFLKPLRYILQHNVMSTQYAIDICRKFSKLDAFVYTSSSYGNANRKTVIQETIYRLPFHAQRFLDEISNGSDDSLDELVAECHPKWPNFYTFSKVLAENVLQDNARDLPIIIIRPSIIGSVWKRPLPGYIEETSGITALTIGVGKGFLKCLKGDPCSKFDFVTGDISAGTHIVAAWSIATKRSPPLHVINNSSNVIIELNHYSRTLQEMAKKNPLPKTFRNITGFRFIKNRYLYWVYAFYQHYVPAYSFDALLALSGSKMRLVPIYRMADKAMASLTFFMSHYWTFTTENFQNLLKQLRDEDLKMFALEQTEECPEEEIAALLPLGAPFFQWENDNKTKEDRMRAATQRLWLTYAFQTVFLLGVTAMLYYIFSFILALF